jgi:hypothetical protein
MKEQVETERQQEDQGREQRTETRTSQRPRGQRGTEGQKVVAQSGNHEQGTGDELCSFTESLVYLMVCE